MAMREFRGGGAQEDLDTETDSGLMLPSCAPVTLATRTEGDRASAPAAHCADSQDGGHGEDQAQREHKPGSESRDTALPAGIRDLPDAGTYCRT